MAGLFNGRKALITGGSGGIGFAIAQALAAEGCSLTLVGRDSNKLDAAKEALLRERPSDAAGKPLDVELVALDLSDPQQALRLGHEHADTDILVNCAGAVGRGGLTDIDPTSFFNSFNGKVMSAIMLTHAIYPHMCSRKHGVVVNIIGIAGEKLNPRSIGTTTANAALIAFTKALGAESVDHGVRVVGVNPGLIRTERTASMLDPTAHKDQAAYAALLKNLPYGRMGEPAEIADAVMFLASDRASYISGEVLSVDAGSRFRG